MPADDTDSQTTMKKNILIFAFLLSPLAFPAVSLALDAESSMASARELYASGDWETAKEAYELAYKNSPAGSVARAEATLELASLLWEQGDYIQAEKQARDALAQAKALKLDRAIGRLMLTLGHIEASRGKLSQAEATLKICAKSASDSDDAHVAALCRVSLRFVKQLRGQPVSETEYEKDLTLLRNSGDDMLVGTALAKTSEGFARAGDYTHALGLLNQAQARFVAGGSVPAQARNRLRRAQVYQEMGRWADAAKDLDGLVLDFKNMRNKPSLVTAYSLSGRQAEQNGDTKAAESFFGTATKVSSTMSNPMLIANSELAACEFYARNGNDRAVSLCKSAGTRFEKAGVPDLAARATIAGARAAHVRGDLKNAREGYVAAVAALETRIYTDSDRKDLATQYVNLCTIEYQLESKGALTRCRDAIKSLEAVQNRSKEIEGMLGAANLTAGAAAYKIDNSKDAQKHLQAAVTLLEKVADIERASDAYLRLGRLQYRLKNEAASGSFERAIELSREQPLLAQTTTQAHIQYAQLLMDREKWELAQEQLRPALMAAEAAKEHGTSAWIYSAQARAELKLGNREAAISALKSGVIAAKAAGDKELVKSLQENLAKFQK
jgi:tetratricopeptide (TPR) repeat protein